MHKAKLADDFGQRVIPPWDMYGAIGIFRWEAQCKTYYFAMGELF